MTIEPINVSKINPNRFDIYMLFTRHPVVNFYAQELEFYSNGDNTLLGVILLDIYDNDFNFVLLCRDENKQFRAFDIKVSIPSLEKARELLIAKIKWFATQNVKVVHQSGSKKGLELFKLIVSEDKIHPYFSKLKNHKQFNASKNVIIEIANHFHDIDGNFVEQFQSLNGFDSRLWELYLFAVLIESRFRVIREHDRPDFLIEKDEIEIGLEAVIVDRKKDNPPSGFIVKEPKHPSEILKKNSNEMPLRFGSTLFSKLKKEYWKLPHLKDKPLVFAIADFHDDMSMVWSYIALVEYLFGKKQIVEINKKGETIVKTKKVNDYVKKSGVKIPSGFFHQKEIGIENVSGILFTATGTLGKFTRMGLQAGLGAEKQFVYRIGNKMNSNPESLSAEPFHYLVDENSQETWSEGVNFFHNPNALHPISKDFFPNIAHHQEIDGELISWFPEFHPLSSINFNVISREETKE